MTETRIADILVPELWLPYTQELTAAKSAVFSSGVAVRTPQADALCDRGGQTAELPFFKDLSGTPEKLSDTAPLTVDSITVDRSTVFLNYEGKAFGSNDLAGSLAGTSVFDRYAELVSGYWARAFNSHVIRFCKGVFASSDLAPGGSNPHVLDVSLADAATATVDNFVTAVNVSRTLRLLGDASPDVDFLMLIHGDVYWRLSEAQLITVEPQGNQDITRIPRFLQRYRVVVDDNLPRVPVTNGFRYDSYLLAPGAIQYGEGSPPDYKLIEVERDALGGINYLVNRKCWTMQPQGMRWIGAYSTTSPSNAAIATGSNWELAYEHKNVKMLCLRTNG